MRYVFLNSGAYFCDDIDTLSDVMGSMTKDGLILYDLNERQSKALSLNDGAVLFASSPREDRYMGWQKQVAGRSVTYHMRVWEWKEIYLAR